MREMTLIVNAVNASGVRYHRYIVQFRNNYNDNINIFVGVHRPTAPTANKPRELAISASLILSRRAY